MAPLEYRNLGATGLSVSALGFGCGNVGGLVIRGKPADRERAVARAIELGINYFDTAPSYGDGLSETNLGAALKSLRAEVFVGTKFNVRPADFGDISGAIARSLEASLKRLDRSHVDLFQLHNRIGTERHDDLLRVEDVLYEVLPSLERLRREGKNRFYGITALGETEALHRLIDMGQLHTAQVCYNLLNPSASTEVPANFPAQDFRRLLSSAAARRLGVIVIRVLAAGALSGDAGRHPIAAPSVAPIASGADYAADVERARMLRALVDDGHAGSFVEAAVRFALTNENVSTVLVGYSSIEQLEVAAAATARGPLPAVALERLARLWQTFAQTRAAGRETLGRS